MKKNATFIVYIKATIINTSNHILHTYIVLWDYHSPLLRKQTALFSSGIGSGNELSSLRII